MELTVKSSLLQVKVATVQHMQMSSIVSRAVLAACTGKLGHFKEVRKRFAIGYSVRRHAKKYPLPQSLLWIFAILAGFHVLSLVQKCVVK